MQEGVNDVRIRLIICVVLKALQREIIVTQIALKFKFFLNKVVFNCMIHEKNIGEWEGNKCFFGQLLV